jgi:hypothetical protein
MWRLRGVLLGALRPEVDCEMNSTTARGQYAEHDDD